MAYSLFSGLFTSIKDSFTLKTAICFLGIDGAGKTTVVEHILKYFNPEHKIPSKIIPTMGFITKTINYKNSIMTLWDIGGKKDFRNIWKSYYPKADVIVFVVNAQQIDRVHESRKLFDNLAIEFNGKLCLLFLNANKSILQFFPSADRGFVYFADLQNNHDIETLSLWLLATATKSTSS